MITALLIFLPLVASLLVLTVKGERAKQLALLFSVVELAIASAATCKFIPDAGTQFLIDLPWVANLGIHFKAGIDGISILLVLLTAFLVPLIILSTFKHEYKNSSAFYALILFMQAGLMGVFTALDAFLFYVAWEAALIPIYFIAAVWGGERRIPVTLKFFIYTILGSLFMLVGIIYLYLQTPGAHSFDIDAFYALSLTADQQCWLFWAFFIAFAIKMPIFPFHTWQPDTYTEAPSGGTMLLSGIMLKMGIYGVIRWVLPLVPMGVSEWSSLAIFLSITGIVYASLIAFNQKDMKRLIAYSSIAHVGLIAAGVFSDNVQGLQGAMIQMLNHGINVVGMFFIIDLIFSRTQTRTIADLGGIVLKAPVLAICFVVVMLGNVALPLTNGFVGEFLLLNGIYQYNTWYAVFAGLTIILGAVYMLRMYKQVMLGDTNATTEGFTDLVGTENVVLFVIVAAIVVIGVYPKPLLQLSEPAISSLLDKISLKLAVMPK